MGTTMSREFLAVRGFFHFALFLLTLYLATLEKANSECNPQR